MPAIAEKHACLSGEVYRYGNSAKGWYFRLYEPEKRRYRTGKIEGASTLEEALRDAYKVLLGFDRKRPVAKKRIATSAKAAAAHQIREEVDKFLRWEQERVSAGLKDDAAADRRKQCLKVMLEYLKVKGVSQISDITALTFDDYPLFRKGYAKTTVKTELKDIGVFCRSWLRKNGLISNEIAMSPDLIPKIKITEDDLDANPAIPQDDYNVINKYIRNEWRSTASNYKGLYFRDYLWTFVHLMKNGGFRPSELLRVRLKDITITNPKRYSVSEEEYVDDYKATIFVRKSKTGRKRDVLLTSNAAERIMKFRQVQQEYIQKHMPKYQMTGDSLLFGKPDDLWDKPFTYHYLNKAWRQIIRRLKHNGVFIGNRFSDRNYTIYSLRTTYITSCVERELDVYLVAELVGNSVAIIQKFYHRYDVLRSATKVQQINYGKGVEAKPEEVDVVNLFK